MWYDSINFESIQKWIDSRLHESIHTKLETLCDAIQTKMNLFTYAEKDFDNVNEIAWTTRNDKMLETYSLRPKL